MTCPLLNRLSVNYVRNYGASLITNYRQHCPVMSMLTSSLSNGPSIETSTDYRPLSNPSINECPFLTKERHAIKEANAAVKEDIIHLTSDSKDNGTFPYEQHFHEQIMKKKMDHSYRLYYF